MPVSLVGVGTKSSSISSMTTDEMTPAANIVAPLNGVQRGLDRGILTGSLQPNVLTTRAAAPPSIQEVVLHNKENVESMMSVSTTTQKQEEETTNCAPETKC